MNIWLILYVGFPALVLLFGIGITYLSAKGMPDLVASSGLPSAMPVETAEDREAKAAAVREAVAEARAQAEAQGREEIERIRVEAESKMTAHLAAAERKIQKAVADAKKQAAAQLSTNVVQESARSKKKARNE